MKIRGGIQVGVVAVVVVVVEVVVATLSVSLLFLSFWIAPPPSPKIGARVCLCSYPSIYSDDSHLKKGT
ncbi:hypothetical protein CSUI_008942 [Cystoisospora suis]|uniref:Transmembrane protein n=1 Tax=Cystoisospora suis TaxID=483139 RepID=A0A2C6JKD4_9APIC|nr:hypothetical protein CSUI_008942 [Cystoisospora suis]